MQESSQRIFFDWDQPWLPRLATYLLGPWNEKEQQHSGDLSTTVVVVSGGRAGRRLLELLALEAAEKKIVLIPPRIVTLQEAAKLLLTPSQKLLPEAGVWTCHLAWREALQQMSRELFQKIQPQDEEVFFDNTRHHLIGIIEELAHELGNAGLCFYDVATRITALFPESAEREEPRWKALAELQERYQKIVTTWGYSDPQEALHCCLAKGNAVPSSRVLVAGVVEIPLFYKSFFEKIKPTIFVIAPEKHAAGFGKHGELVTSYWLEHPAALKDQQLIPCERSEDQIREVIRIVTKTKNPARLITIAVADVNTLPALQDGFEQVDISTRWAGGRPFRGGRLDQLLQAWAGFLDHKPFAGPSLVSTKALIRHPDIHDRCSAPEEFLIQLDALEREHLPAFLEKKSLAHLEKNKNLLTWIEELEKFVGLDDGRSAHPLAEVAQQTRTMLKRILEKQYVRSDDRDGHYFLGCLEECLQLLEEAEEMGLQSSLSFFMSDFLKIFLELLAQKKIPEREEPAALELLGWLEMAADDAPCALIMSCHEGILPQTPKSNPLLPEAARKNLGLPNEKKILARDHYFLQSITASRQVIILTPRYNGRGEPVRPSRLVTLGTALEKLPERIISLTQHAPSLEEPQTPPQHQSQFSARPLGKEIVTRVTVTSLRTYLQSPRLFYLQHILKLQELEKRPLEMHAGHFGSLIHAVLGAFAGEKKIAEEGDAKKMATWLREKLFAKAHVHFAPGPSQPVKLQLEEAAQTLDGFAKAQAAHQRAGWKIIAAENSDHFRLQPLEEKIIIPDGRSLLLQGRIDRIDWHPERREWLIIDYKTLHRQDWKSATPNKEHFQKKGEKIIWKDLQLPLYLKLAPHWDAIKISGLPLPTLENTKLCYFQLPVEPDKTGLSEPFEQTMILPAWEETERIITEILNGNFDEVGDIDVARMPTLAALCGVSMLT